MAWWVSACVGRRRLARTSQGQAPVDLCSQPREAVQLGVVPDGVLRDGLRHVVHVAELGLLLDPEVRSHGPDPVASHPSGIVGSM